MVKTVSSAQPWEMLRAKKCWCLFRVSNSKDLTDQGMRWALLAPHPLIQQALRSVTAALQAATGVAESELEQAQHAIEQAMHKVKPSDFC